MATRILVVEDCPINRFFLDKGLRSKGYLVHTASNGQDALEWLDKNSVDLVLMDIQMPVLGGLQTARRIREGQGSAAAVPILALSASINAEDRDACLAAGINDLLAKPVVLAELHEMLMKLRNDASAPSQLSKNAKSLAQ